MPWRILKEMKRRRECQWGEVYSFMYRMIREGFYNKVTCEHRPKYRQTSHMAA